MSGASRTTPPTKQISGPPEAQVRSAEVSGLPAYAFDRRWQLAAMLFVLVSTLVRLALLGTMELAPDEAYYWDWSRRLALGYYDQGPMIAYVIKATTLMFGTNEFGVRFGVLAASVGTVLCSYVLARRLFSPLTGFLTVVLLGFTPLMEVGSLIATYDPLLVFFWSLAIVWLERALFAETRAEQNRAWTFAGIATALGFLSKHTMLFLVPCLVLFLLISKPHRVWLRRPQPYLAFLLVPLLYSGVIWWNAHNHWWTFRHLIFLVKKVQGTPLRRLGDLIGSQALLAGPAVFFGGLIASGKALQLGDRTSGGQRCRFLACMGLPVLGLFCLLCLKSKVQANWPACAWVTMTVLWAGWLTAWAGRSRRSAVRAYGLAGFASATGLLLTILVLFPSLRALAGIHLRPDKDTSNTAFGWRQLADRVQQIRNEESGKKVFLVGGSYQYCAELAFYLPDRPETFDLHMHSRLDMYAAYNDRVKSHLGEDCIFVADTNLSDRDLREVFEQVEWEPPLKLWRRPAYNEPIRTVHIARCRRFRKFVGLEWFDGG
jgi:4-amino-4-deoxy-L-arabinose transferase-like glycosyltransferase